MAKNDASRKFPTVTCPPGNHFILFEECCCMLLCFIGDEVAVVCSDSTDDLALLREVDLQAGGWTGFKIA